MGATNKLSPWGNATDAFDPDRWKSTWLKKIILKRQSTVQFSIRRSNKTEAISLVPV
jgi:hypothetical protein